MKVQLVDGKGLLDVPGFRAHGVHAGLKRKRRDVCVIVSDRPSVGAAVFTTNAFAAAPVQVSRGVVADGDVRAIVCNSGNANACTGAKGVADAEAMGTQAATLLGLAPSQVVVSSTGIIGRPLEIDKVLDGIDACVAGLDGSQPGEAAEAITTTDSHNKEVYAEATVGDRTFRVAGIGKGAGMIHPNMATMLGFLVTDAPVDAAALDAALRRVADATFNMITVDGDESTNDMVVALANGAEGGPTVEPGTLEMDAVEAALGACCRQLARMIAGDGEGATRLIEVALSGAVDLDDARAAARAVVASNLVKAAVHGRDPNWGRIVAALGASGATIDPSRIGIAFVDGADQVVVVHKGEPTNGDALALASAAMDSAVVRIEIELGLGDAAAEAWGCDLTEGYVTFNSAYTT